MANPPRQRRSIKEMVISLPENKAFLHFFRADMTARSYAHRYARGPTWRTVDDCHAFETESRPPASGKTRRGAIPFAAPRADATEPTASRLRRSESQEARPYRGVTIPQVPWDSGG